MKYERLFAPLAVRGTVFPNRIMRTSMVSGLATEDGQVTEALKQRYAREAAGGVGSIVVEAAVILPSRSTYNLRISDDGFVPGLRELVNAARAGNPSVRLGLQIMHFLKLSRSGWRQKVEDFAAADLPRIVVQHVEAAQRARAAGFDFIELHMAHAYTLASFLSKTNRRADDYGTKLENRMRLPIEVYEAVRRALGDAYPLGVRINGEDYTLGGTTLLQSVRIAKALAKLGADFVSVSAGSRFEDAPPPPPNMPPDPLSGYSGSRMSPGYGFQDCPNVHLAAEIHTALRGARLETPVVAAGKIRTPAQAERILAEGKADLIGLCRPLLCDPDWPEKAHKGRDDDIVRCTGCNWCIEADSRFEKVTCSRWPEGLIVAPRPFTSKLARPSELHDEAL